MIDMIIRAGRIVAASAVDIMATECIITTYTNTVPLLFIK